MRPTPNTARLVLVLLATVCGGCWPWTWEDLTALGPRVRYEQVATNQEGGCGLDAEGLAWCWGRGPLGTIQVLESCNDGPSSSGPATFSYPCSTRPVAVWDVRGELRFGSLAMGNGHRCGLTTDGEVWCWGNDHYGQLGRPAAQSKDEVEAQVPRLASALPDGVSFTQIAPGGEFTCALDTTGATWCWGYRTAVTQRPGEPPSCSVCFEASCLECGVTPRAKVTDRPFTMLVTGDRHACGLDAEGQAWCWGEGPIGAPLPDQCERTGSQPMACAYEPQPVDTDERFVQLVGQGRITCGLSRQGQAWCWGDPRVLSERPQQMTTSRALVSLSAGGAFGCGLDDRGSLHCFGDVPPLKNGDARRYRAVSVGGNTACALTEAGDIECWGQSNGGRLGRGDSETPGTMLERTSDPWRD